jgi:hypothetical protein
MLPEILAKCTEMPLREISEKTRVELNHVYVELLGHNVGHELRNPWSVIRNAITAARLDGRRSERALEIAWRNAAQAGP